QLESLKNLPKIKEVKALRKRLELELERLDKKIKPEIIPPKEDKQKQANARRSSFMKGVWRVARLMYFNYPEIHEKYTIRDVFLMYFKRRRGGDVPIGDVYWQNISQ
ncbi:MAG: hypothetical protein ACREA8_09870, partial [Nitrosotalea sp.]